MKTHRGSTICKTCGLPLAGMSDLMYPEHYRYGCRCVLSEWKDSWEEAKADYLKRMEEKGKDDQKNM